MEITIAKNAGFCFGVKRATDRLHEAIENKKAGEHIYTLGHLIHNTPYNLELEKKGVKCISISDVDAIAETVSECESVTVFVRAHGIPRSDEEKLRAISEKNPNFRYIDCTCPFVKKIHKIAEENSTEDNCFVLFGAEKHPEVIGIMSYFEGEKIVLGSADEMESETNRKFFEKNKEKTFVIAAQTTFALTEWKKSQKNFKKLYTNAKFFDIICSVTELRQTEAEELSGKCDFMIVIGGRDSSNTEKLYSICKYNCPRTVRIENPCELVSNKLIPKNIGALGIAAGASTPAGAIQEVYKTMSEISFEQMLDSTPIKTLNTGDTVKGIVTFVSDSEIQLDLGTNVTGYIKAEQITDDTSAKLSEMFKKGDEVEAFVIRVSDIEGFAELSKKRVDSDKNWQKIVEACESREVLAGKVVEVVKGGVNVLVGANRVFVPASQTGVAKDGDLSVLKGEDVNLYVIEIKGKRAIGSIRAVARDAKRAAEAEFWAGVEEGKVYIGKVKSLTSYGAFVDLGGVDGMVHKTELSWKPIATPASVVSVGDELTVFVKSFDAEKKRISLGYKTEDTNPWTIFSANYAVGDVAAVKIVSIMPFGAFGEICDGVDGLIHISQVAQQRIGNPAEVLKVGDEVNVKIIAIDEENHKVSLSIRALLDEAQAAAEAMPEEFAEEAAPEAEATDAE